MKIHNSRELHKVAINDSSDINFDKFNSLYRKYTSEPYSFLFIDTILPDNQVRFRKNLLK